MIEKWLGIVDGSQSQKSYIKHSFVLEKEQNNYTILLFMYVILQISIILLLLVSNLYTIMINKLFKSTNIIAHTS